MLFLCEYGGAGRPTARSGQSVRLPAVRSLGLHHRRRARGQPVDGAERLRAATGAAAGARAHPQRVLSGAGAGESRTGVRAHVRALVGRRRLGDRRARGRHSAHFVPGRFGDFGVFPRSHPCHRLPAAQGAPRAPLALPDVSRRLPPRRRRHARRCPVRRTIHPRQLLRYHG